MITAKEKVRSLLEHLPENVTIEDIQYHLYVMEKVQTGLESVEREGGFPQKQVEEKLSKWLRLKVRLREAGNSNFQSDSILVVAVGMDMMGRKQS